MLLLAASLALASEPAPSTERAPATEPAPASEAAPASVIAARLPTGRSGCGTPVFVAGVVVNATFPGPNWAREVVAGTPGVIMDPRGTVLESRGAAPVLYIDGMRVMTGLRR